MKKSIIIGLLCLVIFLAAYGVSIIVAVPKAIAYITGTVTNFAKLAGGIITPCDGDEGGGGRPYIKP
jgi:hypothetical protein